MRGSSPGWQGVFPILVTPFDDQSRVDEESLRRLVEFNIGAGVHGLGVALGSEVFRFSEAERRQVTRIVVDQARGRVPIVINTGAQGTDLAVLYSRMAEEAGADALMVMPPTLVPAGPIELREYFRAISDAVRIPIFIQDAGSPPVPAGLARQIAAESERVRYIKVESTPLPQRVAEAVTQTGDLFRLKLRHSGVPTHEIEIVTRATPASGAESGNSSGKTAGAKLVETQPSAAF